METAQMVRGLSAYALFHKSLTFPHGFTMDLNDIRVMNDSVTDSIRKHGII